MCSEDAPTSCCYHPSATTLVLTASAAASLRLVLPVSMPTIWAPAALLSSRRAAAASATATLDAQPREVEQDGDQVAEDAARMRSLRARSPLNRVVPFRGGLPSAARLPRQRARGRSSGGAAAAASTVFELSAPFAKFDYAASG